MDISFSSSKLKKVFSEQKKLIRAYGPEMAKKIIMRVSLLMGASTLSRVPITKPPRCHQLSEDKDEQFAVDLVHPKRLVFRPNHDPIPRRSDGGIDKDKVTSIEIIEVIDYH